VIINDFYLVKFYKKKLKYFLSNKNDHVYCKDFSTKK